MNISELLLRPHHMKAGCAAPHLEGFAAELISVGYASFTFNGFLNSAIHFGGWLETRGLDLAHINDKTIDAFGSHRYQSTAFFSAKTRRSGLFDLDQSFPASFVRHSGGPGLRIRQPTARISCDTPP